MKHLSLIVMSIIILSCAPVKWLSIGNGDTMFNDYEGVVSVEQFDSLCNACGISNNLQYWYKSEFKDYESKESTTKYIYIQKMDSVEVLYILTPMSGDNYKVSKRVTR